MFYAQIYKKVQLFNVFLKKDIGYFTFCLCEDKHHLVKRTIDFNIFNVVFSFFSEKDRNFAFTFQNGELFFVY